jgi:C4-dicarboxylate transporter DctQ subunit
MTRSWVGRIEEGVVALLITLMTVITFMQVVARYVFNYSFVWALELTMFLFGGLIFFGISYGVRVGAHIGVDVLVKALPPRAARITTIAAVLLCLLYTAIVFVGGWQYVSKIYEIGILAQDMPVPQWIPRLVLPLGFALLFVRFTQVLVRAIRGDSASLLADEAEEALKLRVDGDGPVATSPSEPDR